MISANVSPCRMCAQETLSTLQFASRAKHIRNKAVINQDTNGDVAMLQREVMRLRRYSLAYTHALTYSSRTQSLTPHALIYMLTPITHSLSHPLLHPLLHPIFHSLPCSLTHSPIHSPVHSLTHPLTHHKLVFFQGQLCIVLSSCLYEVLFQHSAYLKLVHEEGFHSEEAVHAELLHEQSVLWISQTFT